MSREPTLQKGRPTSGGSRPPSGGGGGGGDCGMEMQEINGNSDDGEKLRVCTYEINMEARLARYVSDRWPLFSFPETNTHKDDQVAAFRKLCSQTVSVLVTNNHDDDEKYADQFKKPCDHTVESTEASGATPINELHEKLNELIIKEVDFESHHLQSGKLLAIMLNLEKGLINTVIGSGHVGTYKDMYWRCDERKYNLKPSTVRRGKNLLLKPVSWVLYSNTGGMTCKSEIQGVASGLRERIKDKALNPSGTDMQTRDKARLAWARCYAEIAGKLSVQGRDAGGLLHKGNWPTFHEDFEIKFGEDEAGKLLEIYDSACRLAQEEADGCSDSSAGEKKEMGQEVEQEVEMADISFQACNREEPVGVKSDNSNASEGERKSTHSPCPSK